MSGKTDIEWTDRTWNPVTGCSHVSAGCKNCYAERIAGRFWKKRKFTDVKYHPERLGDPRKWKTPSRIFVNSMSDLFHPAVPFDFIMDVLDEITFGADWHTYQILTKRPERLLEFHRECQRQLREDGEETWEEGLGIVDNVWWGVSVEDQKTADQRIPLLLQFPAAVRFLSCEPLLGPVDLAEYITPNPVQGAVMHHHRTGHDCGGAGMEADCEECPAHWENGKPGLHWVVVGGESGPGARPMHPDWARSLRDQCQAAGVPFFFKQWGEWEIASLENGYSGSVMPESNKRFTWIGKNGKTFNPSAPNDQECWAMAKAGKKKAGRLLDGREWNEFPVVTHAV